MLTNPMNPARRSAPMEVGARLSVVEQVYYVPRDGNPPTSVVSRFGIDLGVSGRPVTARFDVPDHWVRLPGEWPESVQMLVFQVETVKYEVMPTTEQRKADADRTVLIGFAPPTNPKTWTQHVTPPTCTPLVCVGAGESCRFRPADIKGLMVRASSPGAVLVVTALPG